MTVGELAVGTAADLMFVDLSAPGLVPLNAPIRQLVLAAGSRAVVKTMVAGDVVSEHVRPTRFDLPSLHGTLQSLAARRRERYGNQRGDATLEAILTSAYQRVVIAREPTDARERPDEP